MLQDRFNTKLASFLIEAGEYLDEYIGGQVEQDFVAEQLKTIRNLVDVALLIREKNLFPDSNHFNTIVEDIHYHSQELTEDTCVVKDGSDQ